VPRASLRVGPALPLFAKTYNGSARTDYSTLTDKELSQVIAALRATEPHGGSKRSGPFDPPGPQTNFGSLVRAIGALLCLAEGWTMRSRRVALLVAVVICTTAAAGAATSPLQQRAGEVRFAIPAAIAFQADHGTWRGMTVAKLQRYYTIKNVIVPRATNAGFCIQSTRKPFVHFDGPAGKVRERRCGIRGKVVPFERPPTTEPSETTAQQRIRAAVPAIEGYAADHNGYAGMTIAALRQYDPAIAGITIVRATRTTYCIESGTGADQFHKDGPGSAPAPGACPAA